MGRGPSRPRFACCPTTGGSFQLLNLCRLTGRVLSQHPSESTRSVGGLGDVEAIEQGESLIGLRAGNMGLARGILHPPGEEVQVKV
jgi:hypothetical protein